MRWTKYHADKPVKKFPQAGDHKVVERFCLFPKHWYDSETNSTTYYWLEKVYITYEWVDSYVSCTPWGEPDIVLAHWNIIHITNNSMEPYDRLWR